jgi:hypothetical protein
MGGPYGHVPAHKGARFHRLMFECQVAGTWFKTQTKTQNKIPRDKSYGYTYVAPALNGLNRALCNICGHMYP